MKYIIYVSGGNFDYWFFANEEGKKKVIEDWKDNVIYVKSIETLSKELDESEEGFIEL